MADVSVTANSVAPISGSTSLISGIAGATITAGQAVYLDSATNTYKLADANNTSATATVAGIAMNGAQSGQTVQVANGGTYTCGFTATVGAVYVASVNAGGIAPVGDLGAAIYTSIIGVATTAGIVKLMIGNSGVLGA